MKATALMFAFVVAGPLVACGSESTSTGTEGVITSDAASAAPVTSTPAGTDAPPATTAPPPDAAHCTTDAILPVVAGLFPENEAWNMIDVEILDCQNGYARVRAIPDQSTCDPEYPHCLEEEQVFLVDVAGSWEYLDSGTGVDCLNPATLLPETVTACEALGLS